MHAPDPILGLMDRFTAAVNAHDLDAVLALVTDDIVFGPPLRPPMAPATKAAPPSRRSGSPRNWKSSEPTRWSGHRRHSASMAFTCPSGTWRPREQAG